MSRYPLARLALGVGLVLVTLSAAGVPAGAQTYVRDGVTVSDTTPTAGSSVDVGGSGFKPNSRVVVTFESTPVVLATVTADAAGVAATRVAIPAGASGSQSIKVTGVTSSDEPLVLATKITVGAVGAVEAADDLPGTGSNPTPWVLVALTALVLGGGLVAFAVRRHHAAA